MTNQTGFYMDMNQFSRRFKSIVEKDIPDKAEKASFDVGWLILRDAKNKIPKAPRDIGDLHASGAVHPLGWGKLGAVLGFNKDYAAKWHELPQARADKVNWSLPGSGPKYLESKLSMYKNDYIRFIAQKIRP